VRHLRSTLSRSLLVLLSLSAACSDKSTEPAAIVPPVAARGNIAIATGKDTLSVGGTATLQASFTDTKGLALSGRPVLWESSDPAVATITADGTVLAVSFGTTIISAKVDTARATRAFAVTRTGAANGWVDVSTGFLNTCAATATGDAYCWGTNAGGQLGDGTLLTSNVPKRVGAPTGVKFVRVSVASRMACG